MATAPGTTSPGNTLYVVLHGLISIVEAQSEFLAYVLEISDLHTYMYGDWLLESAIPKREQGQLPIAATLTGVNSIPITPGTNDLDSTVNLIVQLATPPPLTHPNIRALFHLPPPNKIHYFVSGGIDPNKIEGTGDDKNRIIGIPTQVSGIRVFEYTFPNQKTSDEQTLRLTAADDTVLWGWPIKDLADPAKSLAVLHIYNEPPNTLDEKAAEEHNLREFNLSMEFLGVPLKLTKAAVAQIKAPARQPVLKLLPSERASLDQRRLAVLPMLFADRTGTKVMDTSGGGQGGQVCSGGQARIR